MDQILGWLVIVAPFLLSAIFILIPARTENRAANMRWRLALLIFGLLFSGVAWWQQERSAKAAQAAEGDAINKTTARVVGDVTAAVNPLFEAQNKKIDGLEKDLEIENGAQKHAVPFLPPAPLLSANPPSRSLKSAVLANLMKRYAGTQFIIKNDGASEVLAEEIVAALNLGGVDARTWGTIYDPQRFAFEGVHVEYGNSPGKEAAETFCDELKKENFIATAVQTPSLPSNVVVITLGND